MKLLSQSHSPYARKVIVLIHELGLKNIDIEHNETSPTLVNDRVFGANPLGKVPVLLTDAGEAIYDSAVICEYLSGLAGDTSLFPADPEERLRALCLQALATGLCDAGIAVRWETDRRPEHLRYAHLRDGQIKKLKASYTYLEQRVPGQDEVTIGTIALACALSWLSFRNLDAYAPPHPNLGSWLEHFEARAALRLCPYEGETHD